MTQNARLPAVMLQRIWLLATLLACGTFAATARAQTPGCPPDLPAWVENCAQTERFDLRLMRCPERRAVVQMNAELDVELSANSEQGFRRVGDITLSPIAEIDDWSQESEARRRGLDALTACVARGPPPLPAAAQSHAGIRVPWLCLAVLVLLLLAAGKPKAGDAARLLRGLLIAASCVVATLLLRSALFPAAFFHQNGHGARWVQIALAGASEYGPGFSELFGWAAALTGPRAERGVFALQAVLGAITPVAVYCTARAVGGARVLSAAAAASVALEPVLARIARSESYFSVGASLAFIAVALLCVGFARAKLDRRAALFALAAGAVLAQGVRVHPLAWVPLSLAPGVVLFGLGSLRRRAKCALFAYVIVGAVTLVTSGGELLQVMGGGLGRSWLPRAGFRSDALGSGIVVAGLLLSSIPLVVLRSARGLAYSVYGALLCTVAAGTDMLSAPNPAVDAASVRWYFPPALCAFVASAAALTRIWKRRLVLGRAGSLAKRVVAVPVLALGIGVALSWSQYGGVLRQMPTDALETMHFMLWREQLPQDADVAYLGRAESSLLVLPLYNLHDAPRARVIEVDGHIPKQGDRPLFYYRSSLCSTPGGASAWAGFESAARLRLVSAMDLPARSSMRWAKYQTPKVHVALYEVMP